MRNRLQAILLFGKAGFIAVLFTFFSCEQKKDAVKIADEHNSAKFNNADKKDESHFVVQGAESLLKEIELAKLAQNNSIKEEIRHTALVIEKEYRFSYMLLKQIAENKMITLPSEISNNEKKSDNILSYEIADDFDKKYFDLTEKYHKEAIEILEKIKSESTDPDIKTWAEYTLPKFKKNLDTLLNLKERPLKTTDIH